MEDYAPLIERAFSSTPSERSCVIDDIEGDVPEFIRGAYYMNGPARFSSGSFRYNHWLDGDGMVCALRFDRGRVEFKSRFVQSMKYTAEKEAGRPLFRTFGTAFQSDRLKRGLMLESPVNVSIYPYAGTLLAFGEQGRPVELDALTPQGSCSISVSLSLERSLISISIASMRKRILFFANVSLLNIRVRFMTSV
jgi:carotenoid cleavage dioxygenase-like enzyme